jgi:LDH2 family malate/lactate/ureidoglycolate dehydrogenase
VSVKSVASEAVVLPLDEVEALAARLLVAAGTSPDDAAAVAKTLAWADVRGRHAQGIFRLPVLEKMLRHGLVTSPAAMVWTELSPTAHHLDAGNGFGQVAGIRAMDKAIEVARTFGMGIVAVNNTNHYGAASYFCAQAAEAECLGLAFTNASPKVAPFGGTKALLGTNPIAFGCPSPAAPILVDFSTGAVAGSTVRHSGASGGSLPEGVALDRSGQPTTDPAAIKDGCLLPAAGPKGFGLGLMVEVLCGILAGAGMSYEVGPYYSTWTREVGIGHMFMAIDIARFQPLDVFLERVGGLIAAVKSCPPQSGVDEILIPGEVRERYAQQYSNTGVPLDAATVDTLDELGGRLNVTLPWR